MDTNEQIAEQLITELKVLLAKANAKVVQLQVALAPKPTNYARKMKPFSEWKPRVHFSEADVLEVVRLYRQGINKSEIARRKGCNPTYIANITSGRQWSKVTGITPKAKGGK